MSSKLKMEEKIKKEIESISPPVSQMVLYKLGSYCSERLSVDIYYLMESVNLLVSHIGEEKLKKMYQKEGKNWDEIKVKLDQLNKLVTQSKIFYDAIQDKKFERKISDKTITKTQAYFRKYFAKTASKISLMQRDLYDLFIFLVKHTTVQQQTIRVEAFKVLEHLGMRKLDTTKKTESTVRES